MLRRVVPVLCVVRSHIQLPGHGDVDTSSVWWQKGGKLTLSKPEFTSLEMDLSFLVVRLAWFIKREQIVISQNLSHHVKYHNSIKTRQKYLFLVSKWPLDIGQQHTKHTAGTYWQIWFYNKKNQPGQVDRFRLVDCTTTTLPLNLIPHMPTTTTTTTPNQTHLILKDEQYYLGFILYHLVTLWHFLNNTNIFNLVNV